MFLKHLNLKDFRSYEELDLPFSAGVSIFLGANGQGKTNIVESVWYLASLSSHRIAADQALLKRGKSQAKIKALVQRGEREIDIELTIALGRSNVALVQGSRLPRTREMLGLVRAVLFSPEDLSLVKGEPGNRRKFLDDLLFSIAPRYAGVKADYDRILKQRSNLLKTMRARRLGKIKRRNEDPVEAAAAEEATLDVFSAQLAQYGAELLRARIYLTARLRPHFRYAYLRFSDDEAADPNFYLGPEQRNNIDSPANLVYVSQAADYLEAETASLPTTAALADALLAQMKELREEEIDRGQCLVGPHRDDLEIKIHDFPAKGYASHGESWSLALALRLGAFDLLRFEEGEYGDGEPILILDDVFAELDVHRRERLGRIIAEVSQVLITTANDSDIPDSLISLPGGGPRNDLRLYDVRLGEAAVRTGGLDV